MEWTQDRFELRVHNGLKASEELHKELVQIDVTVQYMVRQMELVEGEILTEFWCIWLGTRLWRIAKSGRLSFEGGPL